MSTNKSALSVLIAGAYAASAPFLSQGVMADAINAEREGQEKKALESAKRLIGGFSQSMQSAVAGLRRIRENEKVAEKTVKELDRAFRYFGETGNPLPFFKLTNIYGGVDWLNKLGFDSHTHPELFKSDEWVVPSNWKPAGPASPAV